MEEVRLTVQGYEVGRFGAMNPTAAVLIDRASTGTAELLSQVVAQPKSIGFHVGVADVSDIHDRRASDEEIFGLAWKSVHIMDGQPRSIDRLLQAESRNMAFGLSASAFMLSSSALES